VADKKDVELAPEKSGISMKTIIIIAVVVVMLIAASIGATIFFLSGGSEKSSSDNAEHSSSTSEDQAADTSKPAIYFLLKPDFVINFESDGVANFLSIQLQIMARSNDPIKVIESHMPVVRNNVLLLMSAQKYEVIRTIEGKEKLRTDIVGLVNKIIATENKDSKSKDGDGYHKVENIETIYFTGFIMQ